MILSFGIILLGGLICGFLLNKIKIPGLVGMILFGLVIGPYCLNIIDPKILNISSELRQIALVIILTRSGLNLDIESLKKIGRSAILMCFIPATLEIIGTTLASHYFLNLPWIEGVLLGTVLGAVSPAVVSPRMIKLIEENRGEEHNVPKLILAGSSCDDIYVIVLFYAVLAFINLNKIDVSTICLVPLSILLGVILGVMVGCLFSLFIKKTNFPLVTNIIIFLSLSFLMIGVEEFLKKWVSISSLLGIMVSSMTLLFFNKDKAKEMSSGYNKLWKVAEILLFVLVGASLDYTYSFKYGIKGICVLLIALLFRSVGILICLIKTPLTKKEKIFSIISYLPKATVQASIGGIALANGLSCGALILSISVISILITAPCGALLIDNLSKKLLKENKEENI